jgi:prevent-host-death family protein
MQVSLTEAKAKLTDLVRRAEAGEEIVLTRHGKPTVRLVAEASARPRLSGKDLFHRIAEIQKEVRRLDTGGPDAAHAADFLYDENGLPG